ncbi:hypothetical protein WJX84_012452 [Apatococcus fuscideae]|uniref:Uncharacterized protein n=1 Tax=Apatococcus fuscideae TaxID=2026836 RepID=A0AAW1T9N3_9CHLO
MWREAEVYRRAGIYTTDFSRQESPYSALARAIATASPSPVHKLAEAYPTLTGRIQRDERGTHFIDDSDRGFSFTCARDEQSCISNLLSAFTLPSSTAPLPINSWATDFVDELQPDQYLNGDAPIFSLRLTLVRTGAILSFSYSHVLADVEAMGQLACDLSYLYQGLSVSPRQPSRLNLHRMGRIAAGLGASDNDDELIATLPQYKTAPRSLQEWTDWGAYDMFGITSDERSRGTLVSHEALHVPGECLERLRRDSLRSACAREQGITSLTVHDLVCALLWTMREVAAGNDLSTALRMPFNYVVNLRRLSSLAAVDATQAIPLDHFGNALTIQRRLILERVHHGWLQARLCR